MATADLNYDVHVRTFQARQEMAALDAEWQKLGGTADKASQRLQQATRGFDDGGTAVKGFGSSLKKAEPTIGKVATGVSGLSGTLHGATGQTNAMTGAVANMAGAFAGGGLLAVGVAAAITGFGLLAEKMGATHAEAKKLTEELSAFDPTARHEQAAQSLLEKEQARAIELGTQGDLQKELSQLAHLQGQAVNESLRQEVEAKKELVAAEKELERFRKSRSLFDGPEALSLGIRLKKEAVERAKIRHASAQDERVNAQTSLKTLGDIGQEAIRLKKHNDDRAKILEKKIVPARKAESDEVRELAKLEAAANADASKTEKARREWRVKMDTLGARARIVMDKDEAKRIDARHKHIDGLRKERDDGRRKSERELTAFLKKHAKERAAAIKKAQEEAHQQRVEQAQEAAAIAEGFAASGVATTNQLMDAVITGQARSIDALLAAQLTSLGQQVQGIGLKYLFEGMGMNAVAPGTGIAAMGVGAGALAAGTAMAGGGMAWSHVAAGGRVGQSLPGGSGGGSGIGSVTSRRETGFAGGEQAQTVTVMNFNGPTYNRNDTAMGIVASARRAREDLLEPAR